MPTARTKANRKYNEKAYDRISVTVPKGKKEEISAAAARTGESVNGLINRLLEEQLTDCNSVDSSVDTKTQ